MDMRTGTLEIGRTLLEYHERAAEGPRPYDPVVFLHPWRGCWQVWERAIRALPDRHCIAADLYSPGRGDWAGWESSEGLAAAVLALLDSQAIVRCALVGNSAGGVVAQVLAAEHPERVCALVLVGSGARSSVLSAAHQANLVWLSGPPDRERTRERVADLFADPLASDELERYVDEVMRADRGFFAGHMARATGSDRRAQLGRVTARTVVVRGALDGIATRVRATELAAAITGARYVEIEGAGHCPQVDRPDTFALVLRDALEVTRRPA